MYEQPIYNPDISIHNHVHIYICVYVCVVIFHDRIYFWHWVHLLGTFSLVSLAHSGTAPKKWM
jgi:hypothetical protein